MKRLTILILFLAAGRAGAQDEGKRRVEGPLRDAAAAPAPDKYDLARTGITWHKGLDSVLNREKPILLLQIIGNYDDIYC